MGDVPILVGQTAGEPTSFPKDGRRKTPGWCEPMVGTAGTCVWCAASAWFSGILLEDLEVGWFSLMSTLDYITTP